ncbi:hypothetical protein [Methanosarcina acetivorans]|nr:hypothetical protein [Methanosarcina acetivorans]
MDKRKKVSKRNYFRTKQSEEFFLYYLTGAGLNGTAGCEHT